MASLLGTARHVIIYRFVTCLSRFFRPSSHLCPGLSFFLLYAEQDWDFHLGRGALEISSNLKTGSEGNRKQTHVAQR